MVSNNNNPKWFKYPDTRPDAGVPVLLCCLSDYKQTPFFVRARYSERRGSFIDDYNATTIKETVTHWMYLDFIPAPPEFDNNAVKTVPVSERVGRWLDSVTTSGDEFYRCSECGCLIEKTFFANDYEVRFCPNCGHPMDKIK